MKLRIACEYVHHSTMYRVDENGNLTDDIFCENEDFTNQFYVVYDEDRNPDTDEMILGEYTTMKEAIDFISGEYPNEENIYKDYQDKYCKGAW